MKLRLESVRRIARFAIMFYAILFSSALISALIFNSFPSLNTYRDEIVSLMRREVTTIFQAPFPPLNIFLHNVMIAILMSIPYLGVVVFLYATIMTGITLGASISIIIGNIPQVISILLLLFLPHGILESIAYAVALFSATNKNIRLTLRLIPIVASTLFVAALVEYCEIIILRGKVGV